MTKFLAQCVLIIPLTLAVIGLMLGLLVPSVGSAVFELAGSSVVAISRNFWEHWLITVPVTGTAILVDLA